MRIHTTHRAQGRCLAVLECLLPLFFRCPAVLVIPEWLEDVLVVDEKADSAGKLIPDEFIEQFIGI
ncbi:hypothetical protein ACFL3I_02195 [Pseudomonadota bacterium]